MIGISFMSVTAHEASPRVRSCPSPATADVTKVE
jgi:hypothetical protein